MAESKPLIIGNWKMYPTTLDAARVQMRLALKLLKKYNKCKVVLCPPSIFVADMVRLASAKKIISIGVQNIHSDGDGAHTGDISAVQAQSVGARYAIVGHAERRALGETNADCSKKLFSAATSGLTPILCVGEKERDQNGLFLKEVATQILEGMSLIPQSGKGKIMIAYEPVYAIGAPKPPREDDIHQMVLLIRKTLTQHFGASVARGVSVLYGGAVDASSAPALLHAIPEIQGFLVGRASVDSTKLEQLLISLH